MNSGWLQMPNFPSNGGAYTFSSSSVRYDGPKGAYYAATKLRRGGPEGVVEERFEERDSTTNKHIKRMSRGLKDKGHTFACQKDMKTGKVEENEILHNLKEDEVHDFDAKWEQAAEKYIPGWTKGTPQLTGKTRSLHGRRSIKSLPSK
ncbi:hypothetical protein KP509_12G088800 [Ceratopteris richardii]|nr:hypothetical protein KP509_12G088800 [Ceratopteris richardii]